jgi:hypothetical protein
VKKYILYVLGILFWAFLGLFIMFWGPAISILGWDSALGMALLLLLAIPTTIAFRWSLKTFKNLPFLIQTSKKEALHKLGFIFLISLPIYISVHLEYQRSVEPYFKCSTPIPFKGSNEYQIQTCLGIEKSNNTQAYRINILSKEGQIIISRNYVDDFSDYTRDFAFSENPRFVQGTQEADATELPISVIDRLLRYWPFLTWGQLNQLRLGR